MNVRALCDAITAAELRFDWVANQLQPLTQYGADRFARWEPFRTGDEAAAQQHGERIANVARTFASDTLESIREVLRRLPDIRSAIGRARLGETLGDPDLFMVLQFCDGMKELAALIDAVILPGGMTLCGPVLRSAFSGKKRWILVLSGRSVL